MKKREVGDLVGFEVVEAKGERNLEKNGVEPSEGIPHTHQTRRI